MTAYAIFCMPDPGDPEVLARYHAAAEEAFQTFRPEMLAGPEIVETLEGPPMRGVIVLKLDSVEQAQGWYHSPEYQKAAAPRRDRVAFILDGRD